MITTALKSAAVSAMLLGTLASCGSNSVGDDNASLGSSIRQIAVESLPASVTGQVGKAAEAPAKRTAEDMAATALRVNPGPLILTSLESYGTTQAMAMTGQNGAMRTFMTPNHQAVILRNGFLLGTRGLGNDMSVTEAQTEALIRAGRAGSGQRIIRYWTGDGLETPLQFSCITAPQGGGVAEECTGHGITFQNSYVVQGGVIVASRQWGGPRLGYLTIQLLRQ
ncbi:YjbF family lipoprotein [Paracoccus sp. (in: a-proteobacteria)]|uniref:YjbF family lipoprotein n=1 Tax=Paracoccus sp. TaxID=267 RepID=UPI003A894320